LKSIKLQNLSGELKFIKTQFVISYIKILEMKTFSIVIIWSCRNYKERPNRWGIKYRS